MIKQRGYATREDAVLFAEVLVAMHQDWPLLGERGTDPVRSFTGFREIRASIYISLAEYPFIVSTRKTADEHGPVCICEIYAIAGIAEYTSKIFQLWNRNLNQSFYWLEKALDLRFRERLRWPLQGRIELVVEQAASPGKGNPRLGFGIGQMAGRRQNTGDMVRGPVTGHSDISHPLVYFAKARIPEIYVKR